MHYPPAILALFAGMVSSTATLGSSGFTIPADAADGVYAVHFSPTGEAIHELVAPAAEIATTREAAPIIESSPSRITPRQLDAVECGGYGVNRADTDRAGNMLKAQCTPVAAINSGRSFYSISGSVVAYICNFGSSAWSCNPNDISADFQRVTAICGSYRAGWRTKSPRGDLRAATGYEAKGTTFCGWGSG